MFFDVKRKYEAYVRIYKKNVDQFFVLLLVDT